MLGRPAALSGWRVQSWILPSSIQTWRVGGSEYRESSIPNRVGGWG